MCVQHTLCALVCIGWQVYFLAPCTTLNRRFSFTSRIWRCKHTSYTSNTMYIAHTCIDELVESNELHPCSMLSCSLAEECLPHLPNSSIPITNSKVFRSSLLLFADLFVYTCGFMMLWFSTYYSQVEASIRHEDVEACPIQQFFMRKYVHVYTYTV